MVSPPISGSDITMLIWGDQSFLTPFCNSVFKHTMERPNSLTELLYSSCLSSSDSHVYSKPSHLDLLIRVEGQYVNEAMKSMQVDTCSANSGRYAPLCLSLLLEEGGLGMIVMLSGKGNGEISVVFA